MNEQAAEVEDLFYHTMTDTRYPEGGWKVAMVTTGGNASAYNQLAQTKLSDQALAEPKIRTEPGIHS